MSTQRVYSAQMVAKAKEHHAAGWKHWEIGRLLTAEYGFAPVNETIRGWVDPKFAAKRKKATASAKRRFSARKPVRPLRTLTFEWKIERAKELREAGLSIRALTVVAAVLWGDEWSEYKVRGWVDVEECAA